MCTAPTAPLSRFFAEPPPSFFFPAAGLGDDTVPLPAPPVRLLRASQSAPRTGRGWDLRPLRMKLGTGGEG